jgi:hypothetical protein
MLGLFGTAEAIRPRSRFRGLEFRCVPLLPDVLYYCSGEGILNV